MQSKFERLENLGDLAGVLLHKCVVHSVLQECPTMSVRLVSECAACYIPRTWTRQPNLWQLLRHDYEALVSMLAKDIAEAILEMSAEIVEVSST